MSKRKPKKPIQMSLFAARGARDAAMEEAEENAHERWKRVAVSVIRRVALERDFLTVDHVQELMQMEKVETHENRAMGPMMLEARRRGWIESTRQTVQSVQKHCHANPRTLWRSRLNGHA
jgi:hypothetical protein